MLFRWAFMLCLRILNVLPIDRRFEHANIGQVAVILCIVQAITNHKLIGDAETDVVEGDGFDALTPLIQKRTDAQTERLALPQYLCEIVKRMATVNNILYDQHMFLRKRAFQILENTYYAT